MLSPVSRKVLINYFESEVRQSLGGLFSGLQGQCFFTTAIRKGTFPSSALYVWWTLSHGAVLPLWSSTTLLLELASDSQRFILGSSSPDVLQ